MSNLVLVWALSFAAPQKAIPNQSRDSGGGALTPGAVMPMEYQCRFGTGMLRVARDPKWPVYVVRVVVGEHLAYELYAKPNGQESVLLATCDQLLTWTPEQTR